MTRASISSRFLVAAVALLAAAPAFAEAPPVLAFEALVPDTAGVTRRLESYPLVAIYPDHYADLAEVEDLVPLLKSHPSMKFSEIAAKGAVCGDIPVGLGPVQDAPAGSLPPVGRPPRQLYLRFFASTALPPEIATAPEGLGRQLPVEDGSGRPSDDPLDIVRRTVADRLGGSVPDVVLESFGKADIDGDGYPESVMVGRLASPLPNAPERLMLIAAAARPLAPPVYATELKPASQVMGVGDLNSDGRSEVIVKTTPNDRDFGLEIHAFTRLGMGKVFERRSYGCY